MLRPAVILALALSLTPLPAAAASIAIGQAVFNRCRVCHSIAAGAPSPVGPNLHAIFGRKAGTLDNYAYSEAMRKSGVVWDDNTLAKYVRNPRAFMPDNRMAFPGVKDDREIADLLAYLHQAAQ
ncbi:MAG TPA: cytochrome c family protein [Stellaceae bacterium]|nr:cytochrome c family protein [Stellaceae bacterium]